jgi:hypothetical protein
MTTDTVALRLAGPEESGLVRELAELDETEPLSGEILLAVVDGRPVAALSLYDGRVAANPFARTSEAVALLRLRARHLSRRGGRRRRLRRVLRPRVV